MTAWKECKVTMGLWICYINVLFRLGLGFGQIFISSVMARVVNMKYDNSGLHVYVFWARTKDVYMELSFYHWTTETSPSILLTEKRDKRWIIDDWISLERFDEIPGWPGFYIYERYERDVITWRDFFFFV